VVGHTQSRPYCYLSMDSIAEGVGASQVLRYVEAIAAHGVPVELHSFEKRSPDESTIRRMKELGIKWHPHTFGSPGLLGGLVRVFRAYRAIRGRVFVHARSDMAALAALLAKTPEWTWDARSFWIDQRIALGATSEGSLVVRLFRQVERRAAARSKAVVVLAEATLPVLEKRFGTEVVSKTLVIPTCVDLDLFTPGPMPPLPLRILMAGTYNAYYDIPKMLRLVERLKHTVGAELVYAGPSDAPGAKEILASADQVTELRHDELPELIRSCHVGLAVCRADAGISLKASMPTKIAEFLACGRPVVVNPGLGDMDLLLANETCGVVLGRSSSGDEDEDASRVFDLICHGEEAVKACRSLARRHFDLQSAIKELVRLHTTPSNHSPNGQAS